MAKQSSRINFQGKEHKDIYFQGKYHKAAYIGNQLVWEKYPEEFKFVIIVNSTTGLSVNLEDRFCKPKDLVGEWHIAVHWGDGSVSRVGEGKGKHTYNSTGDYTIIIRGRATFKMKGGGNTPHIKAVLTKFSKKGVGIEDGFGLFMDEKNLTAIPKDLFEECSEVTHFSYCFKGCSGLTEIPVGLFNNCTKAVNFSGCFNACSGLTKIPLGLFNSCTEVTHFYFCFSGCSGLTEIPVGLFNNCTEVVSFFSCFSGCSGLTEIPLGLFNNCTVVDIFDSCFNGCRGLTEIPVGLFNNCTEVVSFSYCFEGCRGLTEIPVGLFNNCTKADVFRRCFGKCEELKYAPHIWINFPDAQGDRCFYDCTKASNYSEIPVGWK